MHILYGVCNSFIPKSSVHCHNSEVIAKASLGTCLPVLLVHHQHSALCHTVSLTQVSANIATLSPGFKPSLSRPLPMRDARASTSYTGSVSYDQGVLCSTTYLERLPHIVAAGLLDKHFAIRLQDNNIRAMFLCSLPVSAPQC